MDIECIMLHLYNVIGCYLTNRGRCFFNCCDKVSRIVGVIEMNERLRKLIYRIRSIVSILIRQLLRRDHLTNSPLWVFTLLLLYFST